MTAPTQSILAQGEGERLRAANFASRGKQVLANGSHCADAATEIGAQHIAYALNAWHAVDWQPIGTAPCLTQSEPDLLLLFEPHDMGGFCFVGTCEPTGGSWYNNLDLKTQHPTHWMPLPPAPAGDA